MENRNKKFRESVNHSTRYVDLETLFKIKISDKVNPDKWYYDQRGLTLNVRNAPSSNHYCFADRLVLDAEDCEIVK